MSSRQLELPIETPHQPDRNHSRGGRSFYFFDFDDNVIFLPTPLYLFHRESGEEKAVSTKEFAAIGAKVGKEGHWRDFEIRFDPQTGSFRRFRQKQIPWLKKLLGQRQPLIEDILNALRLHENEWRGPSWNFFWHAVHNSRPLSIITARGHHPETMKDGIRVLKKRGHLSREPNYLSVFPVSHADVRVDLGDANRDWHTARLKQEAIKRSVEEAFRIYGQNPAHRFGMSDDDPTNLQLIIEALQDLKKKYVENSFFVIDTHAGRLVKQEVLPTRVESGAVLSGTQLNLFND